MNNNLETQPIKIPQKTIGRVIEFNAGMTLLEGMTVSVAFRQTAGVFATAPVTCTFTPGSTQVFYTTSGDEFDAVPGLCDAQLKVTGDSIKDYSYIYPQYVYFEVPIF